MAECLNKRCCRGYKHPQENDPNFVFACRNCTQQISKANLGENGGCALCGECAQILKRCGHCGRIFGTA